MSEPETARDTEVCVVGAGPAGAILASELARRGIRVTVIESGSRPDPSRRAERVKRYLRNENPWASPLAALDRYTSDGGRPYSLEWNRVRGVGGGSLQWEGYALRAHADDLRLRSLHGIAEDWPISYETLEPYYVKAEKALGVAGAADDPWASPRSAPFPLPAFALSHSDDRLARACRSLGVGLHSLPQARNSIAYGGRPQCRACSTCAVCPTGAKASVEATHLAEAEASGRVEVLPDHSVLRLETDASGEVRHVVFAGHDRRRRRLTARVVVLAAGAIENVRLLLLSATAERPQGLANRSGLVGKHFMSHPSVDVTGRVEERVFPYRIGFSTAMSRQFAAPRDRARQGAYLLEFLNSAGPTPRQLALASGAWGAELARRVRDGFGRTLGIRVYGEQLPDAGNSVTLNRAVLDHFEDPVPHLTMSVGAYERRAIDEATQVAARILRAAGATEIFGTDLRFAAHQIGTHRMGIDPRTSVVSPDLRAHDVPNLYLVGGGAFVTATASPPTLTIAALAIRAADHIARALRA